MTRPREISPATVLAGGAMVVSAGLLTHWLSRITFGGDEWELLLNRRGWSAGSFFAPLHEHLDGLAILIYKLLVTTVGMDSPLPYQVVAVMLFLLSVALVFIYMRRRVGEWIALFAILPVLFLGAAWDDLLAPFQTTFFGAVACGLGALFALERRDRLGDIMAMALLTGGLLFSDVGIAFVAGATVEVVLDRERFRRLYVVAVPTVLWLLWYARWGQEAHTFISLHNLANAPSFVLGGLASSLASLLGLIGPGADTPTPQVEWGQSLVVAAVGFAAWRVIRLGRPSNRLLAGLAVLLGFWFLTALNANPLSSPISGRYQYVGVILLLLVATELARGVQVNRGALIVIAIVALAATASNLVQLREKAHDLATTAQQTRGGLAGLELVRGQVDPGFELTQQNSGVEYFDLVNAGPYLSAVDAYGSPAYSPAELGSAPEPARTAADKVLASALGIGVTPARNVQRGSCRTVRPGPVGTDARVPPGGALLRADSAGAQAFLRRYASQFPIPLGSLPSRRWALVRIPADRSTRPWTMRLSGPAVSLCRPVAAGAQNANGV